MTQSLRAVIADDEPLAREALRAALEAEPGVEVAAECRDGIEALEAARRLDPDVLFLDVRMPGLDGLEVAAALSPGARPEVVFVTAFDEYAVRAFETNAVDYLLKPFGAGRVRDAVERVRRRLAEEAGGGTERLAPVIEALAPDGRYARRLVATAPGSLRVVPVEDVDWIEAADNYASVRAGGVESLLRETLKSLEARLDPARFVRVHRSVIVNIDRIRELRLQASGDYTVVLRDGSVLPMSRTYRDHVLARLR